MKQKHFKTLYKLRHSNPHNDIIETWSVFAYFIYVFSKTYGRFVKVWTLSFATF